MSQRLLTCFPCAMLSSDPSRHVIRGAMGGFLQMPFARLRSKSLLPPVSTVLCCRLSELVARLWLIRISPFALSDVDQAMSGFGGLRVTALSLPLVFGSVDGDRTVVLS